MRLRSHQRASPGSKLAEPRASGASPSEPRNGVGRTRKSYAYAGTPSLVPLTLRTDHNHLVMTTHRRVGSRAPLVAVVSILLALLLPTVGHAADADWTSLSRVTSGGGSRLDSLHQLAAARGDMHLVHPRLGPLVNDDRVVYQRSTNGGAKWSNERTLFSSTMQRRQVVPNLAIDARGDVVAVAWRVNGPAGNTLFVRVSRDGGDSFGVRDEIFSTTNPRGVGVPAIAVGNDFVAVAWTNRANGKIKLRLSRDGGRTFKPAQTLGTSGLSIDCKKRVTDGLVGLVAEDRWLHVAWSQASKGRCQASAIKVRSSSDRGKKWSPRRTITDRRSYGWPELDARGRTVIASVQSPTGGVIVSRSTKNGRNWRDRLVKPRKGHSLSAADVVLMPNGKALMTYVDERLRKSRLVATTVVSRRSPDNGSTWKAAKTVAPGAKRLRMAANIAAVRKNATIVLQSGPRDGSPRNIYSTRLR